MSLAVWPDASDYPPHSLDVWRLRDWHSCRYPDEGGWRVRFHQPGAESPLLLHQPVPPQPGAGEDQWQHHYRAMAGYLLTVAGTAHMASRLVTAPPDYLAGGDDRDRMRLLLHQDRVPVRLESWEALPVPFDTPALWVWSLADRTDVTGHQTRRVKAAGEDQLQPALATAQAIHDALELFTGQITDDPATTNPLRKVTQWR